MASFTHILSLSSTNLPPREMAKILDNHETDHVARFTEGIGFEIGDNWLNEGFPLKLTGSTCGYGRIYWGDRIGEVKIVVHNPQGTAVCINRLFREYIDALIDHDFRASFDFGGLQPLTFKITSVNTNSSTEPIENFIKTDNFDYSFRRDEALLTAVFAETGGLVSYTDATHRSNSELRLVSAKLFDSLDKKVRKLKACVSGFNAVTDHQLDEVENTIRALWELYRWTMPL